MLRSSNVGSINVPTSGVSLLLVSVLYDGPVVVGAIVCARAVFRSKSAAGSAGFRYMVAKSAALRVAGSVAIAVAPGAVGVFVEAPWCQLMDLSPGDRIELWASTAGTDTWELDPAGFSVDIR
jgi:hypothetical protein